MNKDANDYFSSSFMLCCFVVAKLLFFYQIEPYEKMIISNQINFTSQNITKLNIFFQ